MSTRCLNAPVRPGAVNPSIALVAALWCLVPGDGAADDDPGTAIEMEERARATMFHEHVPLAVDETLDWETLLDAAVTAHPRQRELAARGAEAGAWRERSDNLLSGAPSLYMSHLSDRSRDDRGQMEYEAGVQLPLWRPGQRRAVRELAASAESESAAVGAALELDVAGTLRDLLWDIEASVTEIAAAQASRAVAETLLGAVEQRYERGDLPLADVLLARASLLEREQQLVPLQAALVDAEREYIVLTDLDRRPPMRNELRSSRTDYDASHPFLALANAEVERAQSGLDLARREARGAPTLAIGPRRQRDPLTPFYNDSVSVQMQIPFGGKDHVSTQVADEARAAAAAETARSALLRSLELALHEAEHTLASIEQSLELAATRRELADRQWRMAQTAFMQGEIELREVLRIQDANQAAIREVELLTVERGRAIAAFNQAVGEIP